MTVKPNHLLIVKHGALGDVVRTSYFARALKEAHGDNLRLSWLTAPAAVPLLRFNPHIDDLWTSHIEAAQYRFSHVYSLDDERQVLEDLSHLKTYAITGAYLDDHGMPAYTDDAAAWFDMGLLSRYGRAKADQLKALNSKTHAEIFCSIFSVDSVAPHFYGSPALDRWRDPWTHSDALNIGINPRAGCRWPSKALQEKELNSTIRGLLHFAEIAGRAVRIILTGSGDDLVSNRRTAEEYGDLRICAAETDDSVLRFAALVGRLDYMITSDSLAMHLAVAQRVPFLAFFAPTSAAEIDAFGTGTKIVSTSTDYCSYRKDADNSSITAERIIRAFEGHARTFDFFGPPAAAVQA